MDFIVLRVLKSGRVVWLRVLPLSFPTKQKIVVIKNKVCVIRRKAGAVVVTSSRFLFFYFNPIKNFPNMKLFLTSIFLLVSLSLSAQKVYWFEVVDNDVDGAVALTGEVKYMKKHPIDGKTYVTDTLTISKDCDDNNGDVSPAHREHCNEIDDNCNGEIDEGLTYKMYIDYDGNGYADDTSMYDFFCDTIQAGWTTKIQVFTQIERALFHQGFVDLGFSTLNPPRNRDYANTESVASVIRNFGATGIQFSGASTVVDGKAHIVKDTMVYGGRCVGNNPDKCGYNGTNMNFSGGVNKVYWGKDFNWEAAMYARKNNLSFDLIIDPRDVDAIDQIKYMKDYLGVNLKRVCLGMELITQSIQPEEYLPLVTSITESYPAQGFIYVLDAANANTNLRKDITWNNVISVNQSCKEQRQYAHLYVLLEDAGLTLTAADWTKNMNNIIGALNTLPSRWDKAKEVLPNQTQYIGQWSTGRQTILGNTVCSGLTWGIFHYQAVIYNSTHDNYLTGASLQNVKSELITNSNQPTVEGHFISLYKRFYEALSIDYVSIIQPSGTFAYASKKGDFYDCVIVNPTAYTILNPQLNVNGAIRTPTYYYQVTGATLNSSTVTITEANISLVTLPPYSSTYIKLTLTGVPVIAGN